MIAQIESKNCQFKVDLSKPLDISIPLRAGTENVSAWYVDPIKIEPVRTEQFTGSVEEGGSVNFRDISFNPHGNGTHTECVGHISKKVYSINQNLKQFFFLAEVISVQPEKQANGDFVITAKQCAALRKSKDAEAIVIRTLPNDEEKKNKQYSSTNPPYIEKEAVVELINSGINHLLIDLPSVDREVDGGVLAAHHSFWEYPENPQMHRTITELIYVADHIKDGEYLLNLQIAPFENDASPSKPVLYKLI
ncbi:MAG: cyclase family protein [Vicingaceae bacterium]